MAKKKRAGKSKSDHIQGYLEQNPDASPTEVIDALARKRVKVSTSLVGKIKYELKQGTKPTPKRKPKKRAARKKAAPVATPATAAFSLTMEDLLEAKKLVDELGSVEEVRKALDALEKLRV
jgi:hypothetical protein